MPGRSKLQTVVEEVFAEGGLLEKLYGMEYREQQHLYATDVCRWLKMAPGSVAMMEGETGIGKSLAYMVPLSIHLAMTGKRALISTYTVHLIHQLNSDKSIIKTVLEHLNLRPIKFANRLGRSQYISASRLLTFAENIEDTASRKQLLALHKRIQKEYGHHVYAKYLSENAGAVTLAMQDAVQAIVLTEHCSDDDAQWYTRDCEASNIADIVMTSHTCSMLYARGIGVFNSEKPFSLLIADEADRIPEAAESIMRLRTSPKRVAAIIEEMQDLTGWKKTVTKRVSESLQRLQNILDESGTHFKTRSCILSRELPSRESLRYTAAVKEVSTLLRPLIKDLTTSDTKTELSTEKITTVRAFDKSLESLMRDKQQSNCIAWSPVNRIGTIAVDDPFAGLKFSRLVRGSEDKGPISVMLTSGTLGQSDKNGLSRYTPIRANLGLKESDVKIWGHYAPRTYGRISFIIADRQIPKPFRNSDAEQGSYEEAWLRYVADMLSASVDRGATLCLCPSFREVEEIRHLLDKRTDIGWHTKGTKLDTLIEVLQTGEIAAIVTPSAWEGISIRGKRGGQILRNVMVTRIPIQPPNDVIESTFIARFQDQGRSKDSAVKALYARVRDRALRKFQQGLIGRGIRANHDRITAWIADPRVGSDRQHRLTGVIPSRFLNDYKEARYFCNENGASLIKPEQNTGKREVIAWL